MDATEVQFFAPGQIVEGKYRIERMIAQGGMGAIYHAVQQPLGRDVAIKVLKPADDTPAKRAQREKRFFREAAVSGKLTHPNTIVVLDYGKLADQPGFFLVMEYLEGQSLRELLRDRGSLGTRLTLHVAMQIASSLADAHRAGCVHRDLKPPNVMLVPRGDDPYFVKVVDFGLVKQLEPEEGDEELTSENALIGSPMYMAPERFLSHNADSPAVDVYALGIMMYEMLVGRPPFIRESDSTLQHIMMMHIQDEPPMMGRFRPDLELPLGLEALVMKCLAKRPENRIDSMDVLLRLLRSCAVDAGMSVAGPIEDTGAYFQPEEIVALKQQRRNSTSDNLLPDDTGEATRATVEQPYGMQMQTHDPQSGPLPTLGAQTQPPQSQSKINTAALVVVFVLLLATAAGLYTLLPGEGEPTQLIVNSNPSGAMIWVEEVSIGATPFDGPVTVKDAATLRIQKDGYEDFHYRVAASPGERVVVDAKLIPADGEAIPVAPADDKPAEDTVEKEPRPEGSQTNGAEEKPAEPEPRPKPKPEKKPRPKPDKKPDKKPSDPDIKLDR